MTKTAYDEGVDVMSKLEKKGFQARFVGGCVRDRLLGLTPVDYDIATTATPTEVMTVLRSYQMKVIPTGLDYGTVTVVLPHGPIEVTTLREDVATDGRYAKVKFGNDFLKDARRRDFTINALSEDKEGNLYDYFSGVAHLKAKQLVFVGDPLARLQEDYLRILRFFRFKSRFALSADLAATDAIRKSRSGLMRLSQERISKELEGLFASVGALAHLQEMFHLVLWPYVFSYLPKEIVQDNMFVSKVMAILKQLQTKGVPCRWSLFVATTCLVWQKQSSVSITKASLDGIWTSLKLSKKEGDEISTLVSLYDKSFSFKDKQAQALMFIDYCEKKRRVGFFESSCFPFWRACAHVFESKDRYSLLDCLMLFETTKGHLRRSVMPITASDIQKTIKMPSGPKLGKCLETLRIAYLSGKWSSREEGLLYLEKNFQS